MRWIEHHWRQDTVVSRLLLPAAMLYCAAATLKRRLYRSGWCRAVSFSVPIIVVGNITVGGTGKTPLVLWIARYLASQGWRPGIVTRGYRGRASTWPQLVTADSDPDRVGDEPVLLAARADAPVVADPDRPRGVARLLAQNCNIIVADDGLQHYRLHRDVEIAVVDGERRLGNGRCLPAGPLRERPARLAEVDARVLNGAAAADAWSMTLVPSSFRRVGASADSLPTDGFRGRRVHALAGIGNPERFFRLLRALGADVSEHPLPDHYRYRAQDLRFRDGATVVMTEKDAVKCRHLAGSDAWYLAVDADIDPRFGDWLQQRLRSK
jgi:tetraacyldisaccharide 4'-kinase